jgi:transketolase
MSDETLKLLAKNCYLAKKTLLNLHHSANSGHVGSALSCCEILTFVRFYCKKTGDEIILSKGHAASALYSTLAVAQDIKLEDLVSGYYKDGTLFSAHPPPNKLSGIKFATGSLGHGPGIACGLALAEKLKNDKHNTFCIVSDGELNEGSVWEAFAFASHHNLNNLFFFVDRNKLQGFGRTSDVLQMEPLADKLQSFGCNVINCDGHSFASLIDTYEKSLVSAAQNNKPTVIIADTTKGRGLKNLENTVDCHYLPMTDEVYKNAIDYCEHEYSKRTSI